MSLVLTLSRKECDVPFDFEFRLSSYWHFQSAIVMNVFYVFLPKDIENFSEFTLKTTHSVLLPRVSIPVYTCHLNLVLG
jgi:hypothetical protein